MKPKNKIDGLTFFPVPEFDDITCAFGADESSYFNRRNLPEIPSKYKDKANDLMFNGGAIDVCDKVDKSKALKAVSAWLRSFAPAHESKIATVGYALWLWSDSSNF